MIMIADKIKSYFDIIWLERSWSWTVLGILYILAALFVRGWFLSSLFSRLKEVEHGLHHRIKAAYLKRSFWGWLFFFIPLGISILVWRKDIFPLKIDDRILILSAFASFIFSVILHLQAFGIAVLEVLRREALARQEEKLLES